MMSDNKILSEYGCYLFSEEVMRDRLPNSTFNAFKECIKNGVRKVNIATASFDAVAKASKEITSTDKPNYFNLSQAMADAVYENVKKHIKIFNMEKLKSE